VVNTIFGGYNQEMKGYQQMNKKLIRKQSNKWIAKWIDKTDKGDFHNQLKAERERRAKE